MLHGNDLFSEFCHSEKIMIRKKNIVLAPLFWSFTTTLYKSKGPGPVRIIQLQKKCCNIVTLQNVRSVTLPATLIRAKYSVEKTFDCSAAARQTLLCNNHCNLGRKPSAIWGENQDRELCLSWPRYQWVEAKDNFCCVNSRIKNLRLSQRV